MNRREEMTVPKKSAHGKEIPGPSNSLKVTVLQLPSIMRCGVEWVFSEFVSIGHVWFKSQRTVVYALLR